MTYGGAVLAMGVWFFWPEASSTFQTPCGGALLGRPPQRDPRSTLINLMFGLWPLFQKKNAFSVVEASSRPVSGEVPSRNHVSPTGPSPTTKTKSIETLRHWIAIRVTALALIPSLLILLFGFISSVQSYHFDVFNAASLTVLFMSLWVSKSFWIKICLVVLFATLLVHLVKGNEDVMHDYIHHEKTRIFCFFLLKCVQIELLKYIYLFIIF